MSDVNGRIDLVQLLADSGLSGLTAFATTTTTAAALRRYVAALNGAGPLDAEAARLAAVREMKAHGVRDAHRLASAAFAERKASEAIASGSLQGRGVTLTDAEPWPDPVLLDSWSADQRGGTGRTWDWDAARELLANRRVIVAGGLTPDNVADIVRAYRPFGVDVSSGVEASVRVKDPNLVRAFVQAVQIADEAGR